MSVKSVNKNDYVGKFSTAAVGGALIGAAAGYLGQKSVLRNPKFINDTFILQLHNLKTALPKTQEAALSIAKDKHIFRSLYKNFRDYVAKGEISKLVTYRAAATGAVIAAGVYSLYRAGKSLFSHNKQI